jgi:hypothetical protein
MWRHGWPASPCLLVAVFVTCLCATALNASSASDLSQKTVPAASAATRTLAQLIETFRQQQTELLTLSVDGIRDIILQPRQFAVFLFVSSNDNRCDLCSALEPELRTIAQNNLPLLVASWEQKGVALNQKATFHPVVLKVTIDTLREALTNDPALEHSFRQLPLLVHLGALRKEKRQLNFSPSTDMMVWSPNTPQTIQAKAIWSWMSQLERGHHFPTLQSTTTPETPPSLLSLVAIAAMISTLLVLLLWWCGCGCFHSHSSSVIRRNPQNPPPSPVTVTDTIADDLAPSTDSTTLAVYHHRQRLAVAYAVPVFLLFFTIVGGSIYSLLQGAQPFAFSPKTGDIMWIYPGDIRAQFVGEGFLLSGAFLLFSLGFILLDWNLGGHAPFPSSESGQHWWISLLIFAMLLFLLLRVESIFATKMTGYPSAIYRLLSFGLGMDH